MSIAPVITKSFAALPLDPTPESLILKFRSNSSVPVMTREEKSVSLKEKSVEIAENSSLAALKVIPPSLSVEIVGNAGATPRRASTRLSSSGWTSIRRRLEISRRFFSERDLSELRKNRGSRREIIGVTEETGGKQQHLKPSVSKRA
ncbi:MAG: hypothetical protein KDB00_24360 [Planctomycetales bacterium]|nr:hypothetical protein [Planctomycetales bacterium]